MSRRSSFDAVRAMGRTLLDVEEVTYWGAPALKARGVCIRHRWAGPTRWERTCRSEPIARTRTFGGDVQLRELGTGGSGGADLHDHRTASAPRGRRQGPRDEIVLGGGAGRVEVRLDARSFVPFPRVEMVCNGEVVASGEDAAGTREMTLHETVSVNGPGWLAARYSSRLGPTTAWGLAIQAHTSPIYFRVPGRELFSAPPLATCSR